MVYDVRDRISYHTEEDVRKAAEYINKLEEVKSTKKVLVTTHSRLFHTDFKHRTIIFDEDPINELLNIQQFNLKDISLIKEYSIDKVFLYLRDAELHQIIESRMFNADLEQMMDNCIVTGKQIERAHV